MVERTDVREHRLHRLALFVVANRVAVHGQAGEVLQPRRSGALRRVDVVVLSLEAVVGVQVALGAGPHVVQPLDGDLGMLALAGDHGGGADQRLVHVTGHALRVLGEGSPGVRAGDVRFPQQPVPEQHPADAGPEAAQAVVGVQRILDLSGLGNLLRQRTRLVQLVQEREIVAVRGTDVVVGEHAIVEREAEAVVDVQVETGSSEPLQLPQRARAQRNLVLLAVAIGILRSERLGHGQPVVEGLRLVQPERFQPVLADVPVLVVTDRRHRARGGGVYLAVRRHQGGAHLGELLQQPLGVGRIAVHQLGQLDGRALGVQVHRTADHVVPAQGQHVGQVRRGGDPGLDEGGVLVARHHLPVDGDAGVRQDLLPDRPVAEPDRVLPAGVAQRDAARLHDRQRVAGFGRAAGGARVGFPGRPRIRRGQSESQHGGNGRLSE